MRTPKLALAVALAAAGMAPATLAAGQAVPQHCSPTYSLHRAVVAADVTFRKARFVHKAEWQRLFRIDQCQEHSWDIPRVRRDRLADEHEWHLRRVAAKQAALRKRMHYGVASYYDDGGALACARASNGMGVANRYLPCGTHVTFYHGGHVVHAIVDDRGPYIAGRDWDFNQNVAAAMPEIYGPGYMSVGYTIP